MRRIFSTVALVFVIAAFSAASAYGAVVNYYFTGTCGTGCTGTVTATMVVSGYTLGTSINPDVLSFTYLSSDISYTTAGFWICCEVGSLPATLPAPANIIVQGYSGSGTSFPVGDFFSDNTSTDPWTVDFNASVFVEDDGTNGCWATAPGGVCSSAASTPEPGSLALFGAGLLCTVGVERRKLRDRVPRTNM